MSTVVLALLSYVGPKIATMLAAQYLLPVLVRAGVSGAGQQAAIAAVSQAVERLLKLLDSKPLTEEEKQIVARDRATIFQHFSPLR